MRYINRRRNWIYENLGYRSDPKLTQAHCRQKQDNPHEVVTDRLRSYRAAMKQIGNEDRQSTERWLNNRAENSHQPFRRLERAMAKFKSAQSLQKFASVHSSLHNHFNHARHLSSRATFKFNRIAALSQRRQLAA